MPLVRSFLQHPPSSDSDITDIGGPGTTPPHRSPSRPQIPDTRPQMALGPQADHSPFPPLPRKFPGSLTPPPTGLKGAPSLGPSLYQFSPSLYQFSPSLLRGKPPPHPAAGSLPPPPASGDQEPRGGPGGRLTRTRRVRRAAAGRTDLVQGSESVHIGVIDISAAVQQLEDLVRVAAGASSQEDGAIIELHLGLLALHHGRLEVRLGADPALQLLVPLLLRVRHLHPLSCRRVFLSRGGERGGGEGREGRQGVCDCFYECWPEEGWEPGGDARDFQYPTEHWGGAPGRTDLPSYFRSPPAPRPATRHRRPI